MIRKCLFQIFILGSFSLFSAIGFTGEDECLHSYDGEISIEDDTIEKITFFCLF